ncbi:MAG: hypothetical protein IT158_07240 [Bryobacterales bacterium]|nr:hypothetical protein [Bryobacterales bacterium]
MTGNPDADREAADANTAVFYCPACRQPVAAPLMCGDCHSLICRQCGTPLEAVDELGMG